LLNWLDEVWETDSALSATMTEEEWLEFVESVKTALEQ
jgi:hypothetical protein